MNEQNIGLWFYKTFLHDFVELPDSEKNNSKVLNEWVENNSSKILNLKWNNYSLINKSVFDNISFPGNILRTLELTTIYPGLVCGIGYEHKLGFANEFKLGFSFDHASGLPYIPGSSIKGTLRSAFKDIGYLKSFIKERMEFNPDLIDWRKLEKHIFEGLDYDNKTELNTYQTDVFFDAFISSVKDNSYFISDDYITSHKQKDGSYSPLLDPNPIRFLKVRSAVTFKFQFRLFDVITEGRVMFSGELKECLFKQILLDLGIGAKTNVGYGQFEEA